MKNLISQIQRLVFCGAEVPRSGKWRSVREAWLKDHPTCAACGSTKDLEVHHKKPFHLFPALELDSSNFITLCETLGKEHHLKLGHTVNGVSSWSLFNVNVVTDAAAMLGASPSYAHPSARMKRRLSFPQVTALPWWMRMFVATSGDTIIDTIAGVEIHYRKLPFEYVSYTTDLMEDDDGSGPSQGDPCYQNDTTLHKNGKPLNSLVDLWIVVPPQIIARTKGICMGSKVRVTRISTGRSVICVVGDKGPPDKIGEGSQALSEALGVDDNPITGGDNAKDYFVEIYIGEAAPGYELQAA